MRSKQCVKCACVKPLEDFYSRACRSDGKESRCKECIKADVRANRNRSADATRAADRARARNAGRYAATKAINLKWRAAHPDRAAAQSKLQHAVRKGRITPWPVCAIPECDCKPVAHHPDYSRPLDVVWLCPPHHQQAHALVKDHAHADR